MNNTFRPPVYDPAAMKALHEKIFEQRQDDPQPEIMPARPMVRLADEFPPASEAAVEKQLNRYRCLTRPLPYADPPQENQLLRIADTSPRFTAAISLIVARVRFARQMKAKRVALPPILLVGPPGCGKSFIAQEIARILAPKPFVYTCAGVSSAVPVKGSPRTFHEAGPGIVIEAISRAHIANPCIMLDELDKAGSSDWNGQFHSALLPRLEPATSAALYDDFLMTEVNQSLVTWIATANDISALPQALRSRFEIFKIPCPDKSELETILEEFRSEFVAEYGIDADELPPLCELAVSRLLREVANGADLRKLRRLSDAEMIANVDIIARTQELK